MKAHSGRRGQYPFLSFFFSDVSTSGDRQKTHPLQLGRLWNVL
ncbi:hypothetical protein CES86_3862 [Brucella lupini]|uniref:Uncharacterized protein n=1 Tax=Brucella lupini TaxID=255457 RepID=A0A256GGW5_9HYPH|nr:hypothetical protein CES86_3862 [Brucella lupini]